MTAATVRRQTWARVLLTLLLAAVLVPTVSRGLARVRGAAEPWLQGCAHAGLAGAEARANPAVAIAWRQLLDHCPLCGLDRDGPDGPPPASVAPALLALVPPAPSALAAWPRRALPAHWRPRPRAPPRLS